MKVIKKLGGGGGRGEDQEILDDARNVPELISMGSSGLW